MQDELPDNWFAELQEQVTPAPAPITQFPSTKKRRQKRFVPGSQAIVSNMYVNEMYREATRNKEGALQQMVQRLSAEYPLTPELSHDVLSSLYLYYPQQQPVAPEYTQNAAAIAEMLSTDEFASLHELTEGNPLNAQMAARTMTEQLVEVLKTAAEMPQPSVAPPNADENQPPGQPGQTPGQPGQTPGQPGAPQQPPTQAQATAQMQTRVAARHAAKEAASQVQDIQQALATFGGSNELGPGWGSEEGAAHQDGDFRERLKMAQRILNDRQLRRIMEMAGRMRKIAIQVERTRTQSGAQQLYSITTGNDLADVLPEEFLRLNDEQQRMQFLIDLTESNLLQYKYRTPKPEGRGDIDVVCDESSSMMGDPIAWAKALELTMHTIAAKQKRNMRVVRFSSARNLDVQDFPHGKANAQAVIESVLHFFGGGTNYDRALEATLDNIEGGFKKPDVIFITDGLCQVNEALLQRWHKAKREKNFRCTGILIGQPQRTEILDTFCDEVFVLPPKILSQGRISEAALTHIFQQALG